MGNLLEPKDLDECDPIITNADLGRESSLSGSSLEPNDAAFPCGLVAKSFFNDTFTLYDTDGGSKGKAITIASDNIAWSSDIDYRFKNL